MTILVKLKFCMNDVHRMLMKLNSVNGEKNVKKNVTKGCKSPITYNLCQ